VGVMPGMVLAGQKKDLVITNRSPANPLRVRSMARMLKAANRYNRSARSVENYAHYSHGVTNRSKSVTKQFRATEIRPVEMQHQKLHQQASQPGAHPKAEV
jgi:hypothetical protein